ncbi:MAG: hypothetical protein LH614_10220 [Pyrinomonadaceae bacterium]|nr:hypothetical protein [Pyrinomonadaceae bacterium]
MGIIICDGLGNIFNKIGESSAYNAGEVIYEFLYNHTEVSFVLTINSKNEPHNFFAGMPKIKIDLYEGASFDKVRNEAAQLFQDDLAEKFPQPVRSVLDAKNFLNNVKQNLEEIYSKGHFGFAISDYELKISPRILLELLSGKLTQEKFIKTYQMKDNNYVYNFISEMIQEGRLIAESSIEKSEYEQDDDWIVFRFGETDAAVSPFKMPDKEK